MRFAGPEEPDLESLRQAFESKLLADALQECLRALRALLLEVRQALHIAASIPAGRTPVKAQDWIDNANEGATSFDELGLERQLERLDERYGFPADQELAQEILSINHTRNVLEHRRGVVADRDVTDEGALVVRWRRLRLAAGDQEVRPGVVIEEPATVVMEPNKKESKSFPVGERVEFTPEEFVGLCWTFNQFGSDLVQKLGEYINDRAESPSDQGETAEAGPPEEENREILAEEYPETTSEAEGTSAP